jgi:catechol 2,3-dioxygenase-like lactoylglutathione lyase family enzyme
VSGADTSFLLRPPSRDRPPRYNRFLGEDAGMEVLSSRLLLRPSDPTRSRAFYGDVLGLAVYREFGPPEHPGVVFFLGNGLLELSGQSDAVPRGLVLWVQVRDVAAEHARLRAAGVPVLRSPQVEPWGLVEMWIEDPDGIRIVLVEIPADHPLRRDQR